jgi:hypothetical protein
MKLSLVFFVAVLSVVVVFNEGKFLQYFIYIVILYSYLGLK